MSLPINSLYSLTWGDYGTSLVSAVQLLRCHGDLVDCTLAAGGRSFPAHKIVLCAASPFLLDLLKNTPCKHPIVMLAGVNANDLEALLEFVYRGEVSVDHSQLPSLLQAAHCLNIQGLAPQTVTKDDYNTTSIQLHPSLLAQHHVKAVIDVGNGTMVSNEELMTAMQDSSPQHQTIQAHVVEEILPDQLTEVADVKEVISQLLPTRKRKPRAKKPAQNNAKVARIDENLTVQNTNITNTTPITTTSNTVNSENGDDTTKSPTKANNSLKEPKSRSQSEQPASCPICGAVIRQSRNLRRHLELRHFSKPGVKKDKKSTSMGNVQNVQTVTVKKEPEEAPSTSQQLQQSQQPQTISVTVAPNQSTQQHTLIDAGSINNANGNQAQHIVTQHENTDGTTSLSIAQVQSLPAGHQLTLSNINQPKNQHNILVKKVFILKGNNTNT